MQEDSLKQNKNTFNDRKWKKKTYLDQRGLETNLLSWQPYSNQNNV